MGVFLSYRRADSQDVVGRMYDQLISHFPIERVFRDLDSLRIGESFPNAIADAISNAKVALVVIGPAWASLTDSEGRRRLDNPTDFVRIEVENVLAAGIPVVPVLVSHATMPTEEDVPPNLRPLVHRHAAPVRPDPDFRRDMERLIGELAKILNHPEPNTQGSLSSEEAQRRVWNALWNVRAFVRHELPRRIKGGASVNASEWEPIHKAAQVIAELSLALPARFFAEAKSSMVDCLQPNINRLLDLLRGAVSASALPGFNIREWGARIDDGLLQTDEEFESRIKLIEKLMQPAN